jgi:hypothetical protein
VRYFTPPSNFSSKKNRNPIEQTVNPAKRYLGFELLKLSRRLGFMVPKVDSELWDSRERFLADMLNSLPKELF